MALRRKLRPHATPAPANLIVQSGVEAVDLSWSYPSPTFDFTRFEVWRDGEFLTNTTTTSHTDATAADGVEYDYEVVAVRTNPRSSVVYPSLPSASSSGSWSSGSLAGIEVLSVAHAAGGPTININSVTDATAYQFERSTDPLIGFVEMAEQAGTSWQDTSGTAGVPYFYRARADDGTPSAARAGVKRATVGGDALTLGTLTLTANITDAFIALPITGDSNRSAVAHAEYRVSGGAWKHAPDALWRANDVFYGAIPNLAANTEYTVRVTVGDPGGVSGNNYAEGAVTTRADAISDPATLTPDSTVSTLQAAIVAGNAASADTVIRVSAGYVQRPTTTLVGNGGHNVTIVAEHLATDAATGTDHAPYNTTTDHTIVYERFTAPTGSDLAGDTVNTSLGIYGKGPWTDESGTLGSGVYSCNVGVANVRQVHYTDATAAAGDYADYKAAEPLRVPVWKRDATDLSTAAGWATHVRTNLTTPFGAWQAASSTTLYLYLPGGLNPNDCYVWMGSGAESTLNAASGTVLDGPNLRVTGFNYRAMTVAQRLKTNAVNFVLDRNHYSGCMVGVYVNLKASGLQARDGVVQDFRVRDSNMWSLTDRGIAWWIIKTSFLKSDGFKYLGSNRIAADSCETKGVQFHRGGKNIVIRRGEIDGPFNGIGSYLSNTDPDAQCNISIHDMRFRNLADDCLEPEGVAVNWMVTNPDAERCRVLFSTDYSHGPVYLIGARAWRINVLGVTDSGAAVPTSDATIGGGQFLKTGGDRLPSGGYWLINCTLWNDQISGNGAGEHGIHPAIGGSAAAPAESVHIYNTILRDVSSAVNHGEAPPWSEDYNAFFSGTTARGVMYNSVEYNSASVTGTKSLAAYRTATGGGAHTNAVGPAGADVAFIDAATGDALLTDAPAGNLTLAVSSGAIGRGRPIGSVNDDQAVPDLGFEGVS